MAGKEYSRRIFIKQTFAAATGAAIASGAVAAMPANICTHNTVDEPVIDIHQHTQYSGRNDETFLAHQKLMGISTTILLPAGSSVNSASTHEGVSNGLEAGAGGNESCYRFAMAHPQEYTFGACEVPDLANATAEIEKYLKLGAKVIGELKFGLECDAPAMQKIYKLAEAYNVPVLMHWQFRRYNYGFERFHTMLRKFPKVNFLGHAQTWWANVDKNHKDQSVLYPTGKVTDGGITERLLSDYPNMYADMSAGSGLNFFTRDEDYAKEFLKRHQDKLIYGSDCSDHAGTGKECQGAQTIATIRRLSSSKALERKFFYSNAKRVFNL